ncbi:MAG TPA: hypothetical protein PLC87_09910 [Bacteroidales bacterium]|nr:hypothetical protein [Bacteroidales bacterium]HOL98779.1 hypothetical protein [Bacteroidales bacterium]HUM33189.1 hypothetical protein [Bacteroidales bacterium]
MKYVLSKQIKKLLSEDNKYDFPIEYFCNLLSYIDFLEKAKEEDYIIYHDNHTFEYTPKFYSFIKALFDSRLVEDVDIMTEFLKTYECKCAYQVWIKEMNEILSNDELFNKMNISFVRKAFFTLIRMENVLPGSWGIDVETGNWLKLLRLLKQIFPEIYRCEKKIMN